MFLNDLLEDARIDPQRSLVLRHQPSEAAFRRALPLVASERLDLFNAYQAYQGPTVERSIERLTGGWIVAFIAYGPGKAAYVGTYQILGSELLTQREFWALPQYVELVALGCPGQRGSDDELIRRFDLALVDVASDWRGKLIVGWPPPERSWFRRAHKNQMPILAIREESAFVQDLPRWDEIDFTWAELSLLPNRLQAALAQWRGVYLIWDSSDAKAYVGSAYGSANILGRWRNYAVTGHGGNKLLLKRNPENFRFSILQRVSPDMDEADVIRIESTWKSRLHTYAPSGLNEN